MLPGFGAEGIENKLDFEIQDFSKIEPIVLV
jgi:hypothetical protein